MVIEKDNKLYITYHDKVNLYRWVVHKMNSSSTILEIGNNQKCNKGVGYITNRPGYKIKELVINPESKLSMQRHKHRSENWYVLKGKVVIKTEYNNFTQEFDFVENRSYTIGQNVWHQGINPTQQYTHILEVQYGDKCVEEDIERRS